MRPRPAGDRAPESARISDLASRLVKDTKEGKPSPIPTKLPKLMTAKPTLPPAYVKLRGEQFCTDAVGQQAYLQQRLGAYPPAPLPVKPILQVSGPSRGWLSVWGSFHVAKLGVTLAWAPAREWPPVGHCRSAASYDSTSSERPPSWFRLSEQRLRVDMVSAGRVIFQPSREQ
jgi:hypothetical protein